MVWFNVDDNLCFHPKALQAGNAAMGLWVRAGSWCQQALTDGAVPLVMARSIGSKGDIDSLVDAALWVPQGDGFVFHEFLHRNRSKEQVERDRAEAKERQRKAREKAAAEKERKKSQRDAGRTQLEVLPEAQ